MTRPHTAFGSFASFRDQTVSDETPKKIILEYEGIGYHITRGGLFKESQYDPGLLGNIIITEEGYWQVSTVTNSERPVEPAPVIYAVNTFQSKVIKFDLNGNIILEWGSLGSGNGQFVAPTGITVDPDGNVYVIDTGNNRIQKFDESGNFLAKWNFVGGDGINRQVGITVSRNASSAPANIGDFWLTVNGQVLPRTMRRVKLLHTIAPNRTVTNNIFRFEKDDVLSMFMKFTGPFTNKPGIYQIPAQNGEPAQPSATIMLVQL